MFYHKAEDLSIDKYKNIIYSFILHDFLEICYCQNSYFQAVTWRSLMYHLKYGSAER